MWEVALRRRKEDISSVSLYFYSGHCILSEELIMTEKCPSYWRFQVQDWVFQEGVNCGVFEG